MNLKHAIREAIWNHRDWIGGAAIVRDGAAFEAVPVVYLSDVSYSGPREQIAIITDLTDWCGPNAYEALEDDVVEMIRSALIAAPPLVYDDPPTDAEENDLVQPHNACPKCGELRMDWLVWDAECSIVRCSTCGVYFYPLMRQPTE